jgi:hypothetical protein
MAFLIFPWHSGEAIPACDSPELSLFFVIPSGPSASEATRDQREAIGLRSVRKSASLSQEITGWNGFATVPRNQRSEPCSDD